MKFSRIRLCVFTLALAMGLFCARPLLANEGVEIDAPIKLRNLVSAEDIESQGDAQYQEFLSEIMKKNRLLRSDDARFQRVVRITGSLLPFAQRFNDRAGSWAWEVNVVKSNAINAFCLPGGKIIVFTGIFDALKLSDDETAAMLGHEIAHAVLEHARERAAKRRLRDIGERVLQNILGKDVDRLVRVGVNLMALQFSRNDEIEADLVGMELSARAGFDPRAAITLWEKMSAREKGNRPEFLSTHPSGESRIETIEENLDKVVPLYERAVE